MSTLTDTDSWGRHHMSENFYTSTCLRQLKTRKGKPWCGILKYQTPNPAYVEDVRTPEQRRRYIGRGEHRTDNPAYVEDTRTAEQRPKTIARQVTKVFDRDVVKTKSQATAELAKWHEQMEAEHGTPDADLSVGEYVARYIRTLEQTKAVEPSTVASYHYSQLHIAAAFPSTSMRKLAPKQVQEWVLSMTEAGSSASTTGKAFRLLRQTCQHAVNLRDLPSNPTDGVKPPKRTPPKSNVITGQTLTKCLGMLDNSEPTSVVVAAYLGIYAGLRRGEVCALRWDDLDLDGCTITVQSAIGRGRGGTYVKNAKTDHARTVAIDRDLVEVLRRRRTVMHAEWEASHKALHLPAVEADFNKLYVVGRCDGSYADPTALGEQWHSMASKAGLVGSQGRKCGLHDLRHTYVTLGIANGADVRSMADQAGHADVTLTLNTYADADPAAKRQAAQTIGDALRAARRS